MTRATRKNGGCAWNTRQRSMPESLSAGRATVGRSRVRETCSQPHSALPSFSSVVLVLDRQHNGSSTLPALNTNAVMGSFGYPLLGRIHSRSRSNFFNRSPVFHCQTPCSCFSSTARFVKRCSTGMDGLAMITACRPRPNDPFHNLCVLHTAPAIGHVDGRSKADTSIAPTRSDTLGLASPPSIPVVVALRTMATSEPTVRCLNLGRRSRRQVQRALERKLRICRSESTGERQIGQRSLRTRSN